MSSLSARIRTGTTLAVAAAGLLWLHRFFAPGVLALGVVLVIASLSAWELDRMGSFAGRGLRNHLYPAVAACALFVGLEVGGFLTLRATWLLALLYVGTLMASWRLPRLGPPALDCHDRSPRAGEVVPLALWLVPPLFALVLVDRAFGIAGLVALVVLAKVGDNAGYFVGRAIGKRRPFPNISPGKTVAGCVASLVAGIVAGALLLPYTLGEPTLHQALLGALVGGALNLAAQAGDLSESWVKRRAGVKDSSHLVGPSGGVLDVIDSLLLAAPLALLLWSWVY